MMPYTIEDLNGCTKKFAFSFEGVSLDGDISNFLTEKQKKSNFKGFRPGKAPKAMVEQMYGEQAKTDALQKFVSKEFFTAIDKEKVQVIGYPKFSNAKIDDEKKVTFEAVVEFLPKVEVKEFAGLEFEKTPTLVTDEDIEKLEKSYLESKSTLEESKEKELKNGLFAVLNFSGTLESGESPDSMKGSEHVLEIGSNSFIEGFEAGMLGMKKSEKKDINLSFPAEYHSADYAGKKVTFSVELLEIKEKVFPELTDDLVKEFNFDSVEKFRAANKERLTENKKRQAKEDLNQKILEKLIEDNKIDIPLALIAQQKMGIVQDVTKSLKSQGFTDEMVTEYMDRWKDSINEKADFQVKSGLILGAIADQYKIEANDSDLDEKYKQIAKSSGLELAKVTEIYGQNEEQKRNLKYAIREERTFEKIYSELKITEKS